MEHLDLESILWLLCIQHICFFKNQFKAARCDPTSFFIIESTDWSQGDYDGRGQQTASPMLTAIMSGGVGISGRELYKYR